MPRRYIKKGLRLTYDPNKMKQAAAAVRKGLTLRAAAERYEVPRCV